MTNSKYLDGFLYLLYFVFFVSLACCFRGITSISTALLVLTGIIKNKIDTGFYLSHGLKNSFFFSCCIFYLVQVSLIILSHNHDALGRHALLKSAIIFVPLSLCCSSYLSMDMYQKLMKYLIWSLASAMLFCLFAACYKYYFLHTSANVFFYHDLVAPFNQHAIQVSILIFIGFVHLLEMAKNGSFFFNRSLHFLLAFYFIGCILLLSSKLVISFTVLCSIYYLLLNLKKAKFRRFGIAALCAGLAMIMIVLFTNNKISKRFNEIIHSNVQLIAQQNFDPGIYFDGLQLRLLEGRFVKEILSEKDAWLMGVSDDKQQLLDEKYITTHMYLGDGKTEDRGYLGYNTHNQFLESLLQSGYVGLAAFIFMCIAMIQLLVRRKSRTLFFVVTLLLAYSLNESILERQYSITIFTFFPLFIYFSTGKQVKKAF